MHVYGFPPLAVIHVRRLLRINYCVGSPCRVDMVFDFGSEYVLNHSSQFIFIGFADEVTTDLLQVNIPMNEF